MLPPIIAIGSSAGNVAALQVLVGLLPASFSGAVLIATHLSPVLKSNLSAILGRKTTLQVHPAADGETIRAGHIYVAVPDRHLMLEGRCIRVTDGPRESRHRPCIDVLFRSCSIALGTRAIGVVLTGGLYDGAAGLWMIKDCGGTTMVQDPTEAEHDSMPRNSIDQVQIDHIATLAQMPALFEQVIAQNVTRDGKLGSRKVERSPRIQRIRRR